MIYDLIHSLNELEDLLDELVINLGRHHSYSTLWPEGAVQHVSQLGVRVWRGDAHGFYLGQVIKC